jgi:hypothetical protein
MALSNGYKTQHAPIVRLDPPAPDRAMLRSQLVALYRQYLSDAECALSIQQEYEELIREAKRERRSAEARMAKLRSLLDDEFPGWESPVLTMERFE